MENRHENATNSLNQYWKQNPVKVKYDLTVIFILQLRKRETKSTLELKWNDTKLAHNENLKYTEVIFD